MKILEILPKGTRAYSDALEASKAIEAAREAGQTDIADAKAAVLDTLFDQFQQSKGNPKAVKKIESAFASATRDAISFGREFLKDSPSSKSKINEKNVALEIENALNIADERAIKLSDQDIKSAAFAYGKGDLKGAAKIANKLVERIDTAIKLQDEEEKDMRTTAEGIQVAVGKKTGTIYTGGVPASRGRENTGSFNSFLAQQGVKEEMIPSNIIGGETQPAPMVGELETVQPQPELYSQQTKPEQMSALREKEAAFNEARALYYSGRNNEALALMNAAGGKGMLGGDYTPDDLERVFGQKPQQPPANQTAPQRPPLSELIPIR